MTDELDVTKIEGLESGKFTVIAKVTLSEVGTGKKYLQRGRLGDETGTIDFVIFSDAKLDPLEDGKTYIITNVYASDNSGFLTLRPNSRMDGCTVTLTEKDIEVNPTLIFRERVCIPSILKDETCDTCSAIFNHIIEKKSDPDFSIRDKTIILAAYHEALKQMYNKGEQISYEDDGIQKGYMYGFFPYYIVMIYHILRRMTFENPQDIFQNDMDICLYGCGPAPEILGFTGYLRDFHPEINKINITFFDQNNWDYWRRYCIRELVPLYWDGEIQSHSYSLDLLRFPDGVDAEIIRAISLASIHNLQNIISDLYQTPENLERLGPSFFNLYRQTASGSIMILSDQYYGKTRRIFKQISLKIKTHDLGTTLLEPDLIQNYRCEFDTPQPMKEIDHFYKKYMDFYGMILKRS